jgi:hypothetical protein
MGDIAKLARDSSGNIYYNPTVNGRNDLNRRTIILKLDAKLYAQYTYPISGFDILAGTDWTKDIDSLTKSKKQIMLCDSINFVIVHHQRLIYQPTDYSRNGHKSAYRPLNYRYFDQ